MDLSSHFPQLHVSEDYDRDRLSELPDELILEILSFLPMRDVVSTTLLFKRWRNLWITVPSLDFWLVPRPNFICGALAKWKGPKILKFSLKLGDNNDFSTRDINMFLSLAFEKQVEELYIDLSCWYVLERAYSCSSIKKLTLVDCEPWLMIKENLQWNQLKSLTIEGKESFRGDTLNQILSGAHRLEELILHFEKIGESSISIESTSLKVLEFRTDYDTKDSRQTVMRIRTPNLSSIQLSGFINYTCLLDVPSLTDATLNFSIYGYGYIPGRGYNPSIVRSVFKIFNKVFQSIRHVEKLTLSCIHKFLAYVKERDVVVEFSNAKYLKLYDVYAGSAEEMLDVVEMFPRLMILILEPNYKDFYDKSSRTTLPCPSLLHLKTLKISWYVHDASLIPAMEILLQNARFLNKMEFRPRYRRVKDRELLLMAEKKLLSMPRSSPTAEVIIIKH